MNGRSGFVAAIGLTVALGTAPRLLAADRPKCGGHNGAGGCDPRMQHVLCGDGTPDMRFTCSAHTAAKKKSASKPPKTETLELKLPSRTKRGQILLPGEKPPASTLQQSQKDLSQ